MAWTLTQMLALAPDSAGAKAGQALATQRHWTSLGQSPQAIWGLFQGSGKEPYQTQVDLGGPAFRCTCPSRKQPCKHGLGLLLLFASEPEGMPASPPPEWVSAWLAERAKREMRQKADAPNAAPDGSRPQAVSRNWAERAGPNPAAPGQSELQRRWRESPTTSSMSTRVSRGPPACRLCSRPATSTGRALTIRV